MIAEQGELPVPFAARRVVTENTVFLSFRASVTFQKVLKVSKYIFKVAKVAASCFLKKEKWPR